MTEQEVLDLINLWIVANGNNEITADVLRTILQEMVKQPNNLIGNLSTLNTTNQSNLVSAINEIYRLVNNNSGIKLHEGLDDPNDTPPTTYNIADFYIQKDIFNNPVDLWQYNGIDWHSSGGGGDDLTLEQVRSNDDTVLGRIKGDSYFREKKVTDFAQIEDILGKSQTLTETATITASFPTTYFEIDVSEISTFTLPLVANSEQKTLIFQNKSNFVVNITTDRSDFIWNLGEVVTVVLKAKETAIFRCSEGFWNVISMHQDVYTKKEVDSILDLKAPLANPTFIGSVVVPNATNNNEAVALGQVLKNQITKSGNQTLDNSYNGKVVTFTGSGTFTVNNTIANEGSFALKVETGVTVAWAITSPATWRVGGLPAGTAPSSLVGGDMVYVARKGSTNEIEVYGL